MRKDVFFLLVLICCGAERGHTLSVILMICLYSCCNASEELPSSPKQDVGGNSKKEIFLISRTQKSTLISVDRSDLSKNFFGAILPIISEN